MTIVELADWIEDRVRAAREEISRLQSARDALTDTRGAPPPHAIITASPPRRPRARRTPADGRGPRGSDRGPKHAAVVALARELSAAAPRGR
ncbi:MAG: hypothetical protein ABSH51_14380 [Solirubrobacteraceae bacterium]|jgi:hypothetical protein